MASACVPGVAPPRVQRRSVTAASVQRKDAAFDYAAMAEAKRMGNVLVIGSTGGVGQLVTAKLLERGFRVSALGRDQSRIQAMFDGRVPAYTGDLRTSDGLGQAMKDTNVIITCTGTTAFPSARWKGGTPDEVDNVGVKNVMVAAAKARSLKRIVHISSAGVERADVFPYRILNAFGVLHAKRKGEQHVAESGIPFTILRPGRLTDGPYTSYDLNTLLQGTAGKRQGVNIALGDVLDGETSRISVAEAAVQCLGISDTIGRFYCLENVAGEGPGQHREAWGSLFRGANRSEFL